MERRLRQMGCQAGFDSPWIARPVPSEGKGLLGEGAKSGGTRSFPGIGFGYDLSAGLPASGRLRDGYGWHVARKRNRRAASPPGGSARVADGTPSADVARAHTTAEAGS